MKSVAGLLAAAILVAAGVALLFGGGQVEPRFGLAPAPTLVVDCEWSAPVNAVEIGWEPPTKAELAALCGRQP